MLVLLGCEARDPTTAMLDNYLYRLGNAWQADMELSSTTAAAPVPRYPARRDLWRELPVLQINLLEFLKLSRCQLQRLIGQRNSALGQVMPSSQRLVYEVNFIHLGRQCQTSLQQLGHNSALLAQLEYALQQKQRSLPAVVWNASAASEEFQVLFSTATPPLNTAEAQQVPSALLQSLEYMAHLIAEVTTGAAPLSTADMEGIENHYAVLGADKHMGKLLRAMAELQQYLESANRVIEKRLQGSPLCYQGRPSAQARVLEAVFYKFYIGQVQPYISAVHRQGQILIPSLEQMLQSLQPWPPAFTHYWHKSFSTNSANRNSSGLNQSLSIWQQFAHSVDRHTRLWQQVLRQCGMMPGSPVSE